MAAASTMGERVSVLETQVVNVDEKIDELKVDVKDLDHKIDTHTEILKTQLKTMYDASCSQHAELANKMGEMEKTRNMWLYMGIGGSATAGWIIGHLDIISKLLK